MVAAGGFRTAAPYYGAKVLEKGHGSSNRLK